MPMKLETCRERVMFTGVASSAAGTASGAAQVEAAIKARNLGFRRALFLSYCKRLVQVCNKESAPHWQEKTMIADLLSLQQNGLVSKLCLFPKLFFLALFVIY